MKTIYASIIALVVILFAVSLKIAPTALAATTVTIPLQAGRNFISPKLQSATTAKALCKNTAITQIEAFKPSGKETFEWQTYKCGDKEEKRTNNFILRPEFGYMVLASQPTTITITGGVDKKYQHRLVLGWNSFGVPQAEQYSLKASSLCGNYGNTKYVITQVQRWKNGGWDGYLCPEYNPSWPPTMNNFDLRSTEGYLLKAERAE